MIVLLLLVAALAVLATLQYRWIDQITEADRQRERASLEFAARHFADDLREEIEMAFGAFARPERSGDLMARFEDWQRDAAHPKLIDTVYVLEDDALLKLDPRTGALIDSEWPMSLESVRRRMISHEPGGPFDPEALALIVRERRGPPRMFGDPFGEPPPPTTIITLDRRELTGVILPQLTGRHFDGHASICI